jgi:hypothetical protein
MLKLFFILGIALSAVTVPSGDKTAAAGAKVPEFNATKWYNTAPLTLEDLKGKAVLLQVFRTW